MNEFTKKLNVSDYAFELDGWNIVKCYLKFSVNEYENTVHYADGCEEKAKYQVISFEINGVDLNTEKEAWFCFELNMSLDELNTYSEKPVNIIDKVSDRESFIKRPTCDNSTFLDFEFPTDTKEDMYSNISSVWVSKLDENKFMFKVCVPSEGLFSYFEVDFNEKWREVL